MSVENRRILGSNQLGDALLHFEDLHPRLYKGGLEAPNLVPNLRSLDGMAYHLVFGILAQDMNGAPGQPGRNARTMEPNFPPRFIAVHPPARLTGMSIFVEARVD